MFHLSVNRGPSQAYLWWRVKRFSAHLMGVWYICGGYWPGSIPPAGGSARKPYALKWKDRKWALRLCNFLYFPTNGWVEHPQYHPCQNPASRNAELDTTTAQKVLGSHILSIAEVQA